MLQVFGGRLKRGEAHAPAALAVGEPHDPAALTWRTSSKSGRLNVGGAAVWLCKQDGAECLSLGTGLLPTFEFTRPHGGIVPNTILTSLVVKGWVIAVPLMCKIR